MVIGVDFDNTIVCYDELFWRLAVARDSLPSTIAKSKEAIRDALRACGREEDWTELQGFAYGTEILGATPFPGVAAFLKEAHQNGVEVFVISHKTRRPFRGPSVDLHLAARSWLRHYQIFEPEMSEFMETRVFFEETKGGKLARIRQQACTHFIDDLPEFLLDPEFPTGVKRILFSPHVCQQDTRDLTILRTWSEAWWAIADDAAGQTGAAT